MGLKLGRQQWMVIAAIGALLCAGCASKSGSVDEEPPQPEPAADALGSEAADVDVELMDDVGPDDATIASGTAATDGGDASDPCEQDDTLGWLDGTQEWVYETTCRTAMWFDGFFGTPRNDERTGETHGRVGLGAFWDQRDGFDPSLRFRAKFAMPSARDRASFMIGRGDEEEMIEERATQFDTIPGNFTRIDDDSFLVGLGFTGKKKKGFKLSVGAKVRWPPEPYIKLRYRKHFALTESTMLSVRPIVYWRTEERLGTTLHIDIDQMLKDHLMLRWANFGNVATGDPVEGLEWESSLFLFQALSNRRAITYRALVVGETQAEESLNNYGFEMRYRQRVLRDWLFIELIGGVTWPKYFMDEDREANIGIGAGFEMYFGPTPENQMF
ncbi:MAG: hypothetical protein ACN4GT_13725 [Gammaproteobacteria bacterium]